jgi:hypothetical protein
VFERERDELRFLLRELDSWARDGLVSSPLRDVLAGPYRERLDALEREASGKEAVYLQESYGEWLARLGTVAVLTGFSVIAAVSLGLFTPE